MSGTLIVGRGESERREITVLFIDLCDFTEISERFDPEKVTSVIASCFSVIRSIVERYNGTIENHVGECVMALFGAPVALDDAPYRAVMSAIEIRDSFRTGIGEVSPVVRCEVRIGVNTGQAICGYMDAGPQGGYSAIGDAVTGAFRLKEVAGRGEVLVGSVTHRETHDSFVYEPSGAGGTRGRHDESETYLLVGRARHAESDETPPHRGLEGAVFVGREKELDRLEYLLLKVVNGEGSIVAVIGEAGIGKSRLIAELLRKDAMRSVTLLKGKAVSFGRDLSFHPIIDVLRHWAGIRGGDDDAGAYAKLQIAMRVADPQGWKVNTPFFATLMGIKLPTDAASRIRAISGEVLFRIISKSFEKHISTVSRQKPLVIILEDLHWADESTIDFLSSLFHLVMENPVLVICLARPNYKGTSDRLVQVLETHYPRHACMLNLEPFDDTTATCFIAPFVQRGMITPQLGTDIIRRGGGNPLFLEELVRALLSEGVQKQGRSHAGTVEDRYALSTPRSVSDLIMARIDRLDFQTRELLRIAAVIGESFFKVILEHIATTIDVIEDRLLVLEEMGIITERRRLSEVEYVFRHAVFQESIYQSIHVQRRRELHAAVAATIEKLFAQDRQEFYGTLAYHYSQSDDISKAETYLMQAGEAALDSTASAEAISNYQRALQLYIARRGSKADADTLAHMERSIGIANQNRGKFPEAIRHFDHALFHFRQKLPNSMLGTSVMFIFCLVSLRRLIGEGMPKGQTAPTDRDLEIIDIARRRAWCYGAVDPVKSMMNSVIVVRKIRQLDISRVPVAMKILSEMCLVFSIAGILFGLSRRILAFIRRQVDFSNPQSYYSFKLAEIFVTLYTGEWSQTYDPTVTKTCLEYGEVQGASYYLTYHGLIQLERGDFPKVASHVRELERLADYYDNRDARICHYELSAKLQIKRRALVNALADIEKGMVVSEEAGQTSMIIYFLGMKAQLHALLAEDALAEEALAKAQQIAKREFYVPPHFNARFAMGRAVFESQRTEGSVPSDGLRRKKRSLLKALRMLLRVSRKFPADAVEARRLLGRALWRLGKQRQAQSVWNEGMRIGRNLDANLELMRLKADLGKHVCENGAHERNREMSSAEEHLRVARTFFTEHNLDFDLQDITST